MTSQSTSTLFHTMNGYYYGTEKDGLWWKRYMKRGWFCRGNSEVWITEDGIFFRRYLTKKVMHIPLERMSGITMGRWHSGKWTGVPVIKIAWQDKGLALESGFCISRDKEETNRCISVLKNLKKQ